MVIMPDYRCTTGQVSVLVMPSTAWTRATTSWPSSSMFWSFGADDHVVGAGDGLGLLNARDIDDVLGDLCGLADLGLDQDVCRHHRTRPLASCRPLRLKRLVPKGWWHAAAGSGDHPACRVESIGGSRSELGLVAAGDMSPISPSHRGTDASIVMAPDLHARTGSVTLVIVCERHPTRIAFRAIREAPAVSLGFS